jgi:hypothetical protein
VTPVGINQTTRYGWKESAQIVSAINESHALITEQPPFLEGWVPRLGREELKGLITGANEELAQNVLYFAPRQPGFNFHVLVADGRTAGLRMSTWSTRTSGAACNLDPPGSCQTERSRIGHIIFDEFEAKAVSIRHRNQDAAIRGSQHYNRMPGHAFLSITSGYSSQ